MKKPSLFEYATSELSQDAILCWLLEWANHKENQVFQKLAIDLISFLYCLANKNENSIEKVELIDLPKRQYLKIDVYFRARINEKTVSFIIEDKTFTSHHSNQLERYKEYVENDDFQEDEIVKIYFKTGYLYSWDYDAEKRYGYSILDIEKWYNLLSKYLHIKNDIFVDYVRYINCMLTSREENINKMQSGDTDCFKHDYVQYEFLKQLKENFEENINADELYNGTSFGRPWTQYQFVKYENVYNGKPEYIFYRVDSRKDHPYFSIRQYTDEKVKDHTELKDKKLKRLKEYKSLFKAACAGSKFQFQDPLNDWSGNKESEIALLFLNSDTNSTKELWSKWPRLHNRFIDEIKRHFSS